VQLSARRSIRSDLLLTHGSDVRDAENKAEHPRCLASLLARCCRDEERVVKPFVNHQAEKGVKRLAYAEPVSVRRGSFSP
jgi:hypothetical protein